MMLLPLSKSESSADSTEPALVLRGTGAGLEIVIAPGARADAIGAELTNRLEQSPKFFAGNEVMVRFDGPLPAGALARLDEVTARFDLRIAEVSRIDAKPATTETADEAPQPVSVAEGSAKQSSQSEECAPTAELAFESTAPVAAGGAETAGPEAADSAAEAAEPVEPSEATEPAEPAVEHVCDGPRLVDGPIRSGVVLDAPGDLVVVGDVNPGAEIHARGNIMVLGRLRGIAHAAVGGEGGFIMALHLEPQQLRVGNLVARAADADSPGRSAEIAYACRGTIVVEQYRGRIPSDLKVA